MLVWSHKVWTNIYVTDDYMHHDDHVTLMSREYWAKVDRTTLVRFSHPKDVWAAQNVLSVQLEPYNKTNKTHKKYIYGGHMWKVYKLDVQNYTDYSQSGIQTTAIQQ